MLTNTPHIVTTWATRPPSFVIIIPTTVVIIPIIVIIIRTIVNLSSSWCWGSSHCKYDEVKNVDFISGGGTVDDGGDDSEDGEDDDVDHDDCISGGGGADWLEVMLQAAPLIRPCLLSPPTRPLTHSHPPSSQRHKYKHKCKYKYKYKHKLTEIWIPYGYYGHHPAQNCDHWVKSWSCFWGCFGHTQSYYSHASEKVPSILYLHRYTLSYQTVVINSLSFESLFRLWKSWLVWPQTMLSASKRSKPTPYRFSLWPNFELGELLENLETG